ncbi:MAG: hypothetical protein GW762_04385 [Candidatus Pacebacteria bacterium]|nr:hypothetical protein [Candidatus Paceibacterota bacterium]
MAQFRWYKLRKTLLRVDTFLKKDGDLMERYLRMQIDDFIKYPPPPLDGEIRLNATEEYSFQLALMAERFSSWNTYWPTFYRENIDTFLVGIGMFNLPFSMYQLRLGIKKAYGFLYAENAWRWQILENSCKSNIQTGPLSKGEVRISAEMEIQLQIILMAQAMVNDETNAREHYTKVFNERRNT